MTFRPPDCLQCHNQGFFFVGTMPDFPLNPVVNVPLTLGCYKEKRYCDCWYGQQKQIFTSRINHPEYENPFAKMTDVEILEVLSRASDNQKAIDSEFEV